MMTYAPVLISVYHRLYTLRRCVGALLKNKEAKDTDLFVVSDGPARPEHKKRIEEVRQFVRSIRGFHSVTLIARTGNWGAQKSIRSACSDIRLHYGCLIFMEDDILPAPNFLAYMNWGLSRYADDPRVYAVCAYKSKFRMPKSYEEDVYFLNRYSPWGTATWRSKVEERYSAKAGFVDRYEAYDRYSEFQQTMPQQFAELQRNDPTMMNVLRMDSEGQIKAGDVRAEYYLLRTGKLCVYPRQTMTQVMSTGHDAMHATIRWVGDEAFAKNQMTEFRAGPVAVDERVYDAFLAAKRIPLWRRALYAFLHEGFGNAFWYYWSRVFHITWKKKFKE